MLELRTDTRQTDNGEYDKLPESIRAIYSREQYAWLSDYDRATLIERETEPETPL